MSDEVSFEILDSCNGCGACIPICPTKAIRIGEGHRSIIDYDLCIKCGACAKVCLNSCVLDSCGNVVQRLSKKYWAIPHFDAAKCKSCGKCIEMCPAGILTYGSVQFGTSLASNETFRNVPVNNMSLNNMSLNNMSLNNVSLNNVSLNNVPFITNPKLCASCFMCSKVCVFGAIEFFPSSKVNDNLYNQEEIHEGSFARTSQGDEF